MGEVTLRQVKKTYPNGVTAIHGIDLAVADGEFVVLVGPSGCGKSTLLRMVAGLETVTSGELLIDGKVVNDVEPGERDIAMVFQNYALYPHMTVFGNMAYGLKNRGMPKAEIQAKVEATARTLELSTLLERKPNQLSGGQRQRVAMGRAIVRSPRAFLFDEPLSNLDAKLRGQMRLEIKRLQRDLGTTAIYVTHDQVEAMTLADRLVVLNDGHVEQIGTPLDLYKQPATRFVAGFIGAPAMNFVTAEIDADGVLLGGSTRRLPIANGCRPGPAVLGFRPEHVRPCAEDEADMEVAVDVTELLGADTLVHGRTAEIDGEIVVRLPGGLTVHEGDRVPVKLDHATCHLFDPTDGRRLG